MVQTERFEILRSGFLSDGRFFSIEAVPTGVGEWRTRLVCVPRGEEYYVRRAYSKQSLVGWAAALSEAEIEELAKRCC